MNKHVKPYKIQIDGEPRRYWFAEDVGKEEFHQQENQYPRLSKTIIKPQKIKT